MQHVSPPPAPPTPAANPSIPIQPSFLPSAPIPAPTAPVGPPLVMNPPIPGLPGAAAAGGAAGAPMDANRIAQMFMTNMMALMMRLTHPEKNIQSAEADPSIPLNRTIYINNLNDRIKTPKLTEDLKAKFSPYGEIVDIVAMKSFWRRGQVFIAFREQSAAQAALEQMQGHIYEGKPLRINYARDISDCFRREDGTYQMRPAGPKKPKGIREREAALLDQFQALQQQMLTFQRQGTLGRLGAMGTSPGLELPSEALKQPPMPPQSTTSVVDSAAQGVESGEGEEGRKRKAFSMSLKGGPGEVPVKKLKQEEPGAPEIADVGIAAEAVSSEGKAAVSAVAASRVAGVQPSVSNPANKTLFLEKLPADCDEGELISLFSSNEGFERVRLISVRHVAFVDFRTIADASTALEGFVENISAGGPFAGISATFAKR